MATFFLTLLTWPPPKLTRRTYKGLLHASVYEPRFPRRFSVCFWGLNFCLLHIIGHGFLLFCVLTLACVVCVSVS